MKAVHFVRRHLLAISLLMIAACASIMAQGAKEDYQPQVGQSGKDVVWVPTPQALVDKMLDMAEATPDDFVIDLGSGDGRTVITAAKRGIRALGIEYNPDMVELSKRNAINEGVGNKATFMKADLFASDFSEATVITMFLLPSINLKLRPTILNLKPGTRIVSNTFTMDDWEADETAVVNAEDSSYNTALLWIVPAKVEGVWKMPQGDLSIEQKFQRISGTLKSWGNAIQISDGELRGDQIGFAVGNSRYSGRVNGNIIEGTIVTGNKTDSWRATRVGK